MRAYPSAAYDAFSSLQHPTQSIPGKPTIASSMGKASSWLGWARSLAVTQEATAVLPIIWGLITESHVAALKGLSTRERRVLMKALERVLVNLRLRGEAVG